MSPPSLRQSFYADAEIYDILHASGTRAEVASVLRLTRAYAPKRARAEQLVLLEPACGSGRSLIALARKNHHAVGFDIGAPMIRYARSAARAARVSHNVTAFRARMESFRMPRSLRAHAAFNLINTIRHLSSDTAVLAHLRAMRRALTPGGIYIVGIGLCAYGLESETEDVWTGSRSLRGVRTSVTQTVQYLPAPPTGSKSSRRDERVISHLTVHRGRSEQHVDSAYTLRSYNLAQWTSILARARWEPVAITDQDGLPVQPSEPGYALWVLRPAP